MRILAGTLLILGIGEELWQSFLPAFIVALGGSGAAVGLFASCRDLLDGVYQLPGGWVSDRFGARRAIRLFTLVAIAGYAAYFVAWAWPVLFVGLAGAMAWEAGAFPATFAFIGQNLPPGRRVAGFTIQSLAVRIPRVIAAPIGGLLMSRLGLVQGVRFGTAVAVVGGCAVLLAQWWGFRSGPDGQHPVAAGLAGLSQALKRLLVAECLVRIGEAVAASFIVLYVIGIRHASLSTFGMLYALQQAVALILYVPAARLAALVGARVLIASTFLFFALFPVFVLMAPGGLGLVMAFVAGGFKEIGEPMRKASIVDLCRPETCAREVGMYYTVRNLLVVPGGVLGGLIWQRSPDAVLALAGVISAAGLLVFLANSGTLRSQLIGAAAPATAVSR